MGRLTEVFSQNLVRFRKEAGLSQEELAEKIGVARNTIARYEGAESAPSFDALVKLAEALELDETTLVTDPFLIRMWQYETERMREHFTEYTKNLKENIETGKVKITELSEEEAQERRKNPSAKWPSLIKKF